MNRRSTLIILLSLTVLSVSTHGEVYKWVDENGRTHYGEKPPSGNAEEVKIKQAEQAVSSPGKTPEEINAERDRLLKVYEDERNQKKEEKLEQEKIAAQQKQKCQKLENSLKEMKEGGFAYYEMDENGERRFVEDDELKERIKALEKEYAKEC